MNETTAEDAALESAAFYEYVLEEDGSVVLPPKARLKVHNQYAASLYFHGTQVMWGKHRIIHLMRRFLRGEQVRTSRHNRAIYTHKGRLRISVRTDRKRHHLEDMTISRSAAIVVLAALGEPWIEAAPY